MEQRTSVEYGDRVAEMYDRWHGVVDVSLCIRALAQMTGGGRALELGVGTGRFALPLSRSGCDVSGIDISQKMLAGLRAKEGGDRLALVCGNFADVPIAGTFDLIFVVANTLNYLLTQEEQIRCFRNVGSRLTRNGVFVVETLVPGEWVFRKGWFDAGPHATADRVVLHYFRTEPMQQLIDIQNIWMADDRIKSIPDRIRFIWPNELDLIAQIAGLQLQERWGDWQRAPFTAQSDVQIAVYRHC